MLSTEHKVLDLKNRIEASTIIWKRKMEAKDTKSSWGSIISFEERAETILHLLKLRFPGTPQSQLDISKIQYNRDVGYAPGELLARAGEPDVIVMSRIEDLLGADAAATNLTAMLLKKAPSLTPKKFSYVDSLAAGGMKSPSTHH